MLPVNAREGDFVEVFNKSNAYYGMVGRISRIRPSGVAVDIYGKIVDIRKEDLTLRARTGTGTHDELVEQINAKELMNLDVVGYNGLINFAIDMKDWEWAKDLVDRKQEYLSKKRKRAK